MIIEISQLSLGRLSVSCLLVCSNLWLPMEKELFRKMAVLVVSRNSTAYSRCSLQPCSMLYSIYIIYICEQVLFVRFYNNPAPLHRSTAISLLY